MDGGRGGVSAGVLAQEGEPLIDIDDLEPIRPPPPPPAEVPTGPDLVAPQPPESEFFIYVEESGQWVRMPAGARTPPDEGPPFPEALYVQRVIAIPYKKLKQGDSSYNVVIRPNDRVYVKEPQQGVIYIDGEILRPGVYTLPPTGVTLSRLVAAAGGPGALAIPHRVDLTRMVGRNREATIRLNLTAIRQKTEPDIYLKADDHIIIGTSWIATPLAIFRSGLRATYGFGFVLDRNFGNDVFGAPPFSTR